MEKEENLPVITGIACRLPQSSDTEELWSNLINRRDMIGKTRWPEGLFGMPPRVGLLKDVDRFDAKYFGFTDSEAQSMNPLLRHLFEVCYECVMDSGLPLEVLQNNTTGMYTACFLPGHDGLETSRWANSKYCTTVDQITGHVMRHLKLSGPMATVDTACSSSLSALEMAVTDLSLGRCQFALVAGCNLLLNPAYIQMMMKLGMLNPTGQSNVFDANAGGYVRAEGVVAILVTRQQIQCKRVYASIVDIITGCDGYKEEGITFPNAESQARMIKTLYSRAGVDVNQVAFMEAHSTGTKAGDPVEVSAIANSMCTNRADPLLIGSIKANMGHSEATAALASLMKCLLAARHGVIPPQINYNIPNPKLTAVTEGKIVIVNEPTPLKDGYIGLNSFGFGGANGHLILKPFRRSEEHKADEEKVAMMIPVTARTTRELTNMSNYIKDHSHDTSQLSLLATSLLSCDRNRPIRSYFVTNPRTEDVVQKVKMESAVVPNIWLYIQDFVWDYVKVSPDLMDNVVFKKSIKSSQEMLTAMGQEIKLEESIQAAENALSPVTTQGIVVAIATLIGIVDVLKATDVHISGVVSHGLSELVAGYVDGCLSQRETLQLACTIGRALEELSRKEATHAVFLVTMTTEDACMLGPKVRILTVLSETSVVLAVDNSHVEEVQKRIHERGGIYSELGHSLPLYSEMLTETADKLMPKLQACVPNSKYRSPHMLSSTADFAYGDHSSADSRIDELYIRDLLCTQMLSNITKTLPADVLILDIAINNLKVSMASEEVCPFVFDPVDCRSNLSSVLQMLGQIHLHGHKVRTDSLYTTDYPLDIKSPSISSLVSWDHSVQYPLPEWPEYFCRVKDEAVCPYTIDSMDLEGIHTPLGLLLYHTWTAVCQKHQLKDLDTKIELHKLAINLDSEATLESLSNTVIQVQTGKQYFAAQTDDLLVMSGYYKLGSSEDLTLPVIPGYDQDINKNIYIKEDDRDLQRTEIMWEDNWLDFVDTLLEFSMQWLEGPLDKVYIDPEAHMKTVKDCANLLAVAEPCTGLCKAGSVVMETLVTNSKTAEEAPKSKKIGEAGSTKVSMLMAYDIERGDGVHSKVLIYQGERMTDKVQVIGIVLISEEDIVCRELPLSMGWRPDDLELLLPYILAVHVLCDIAKIQPGQKLLVSPPIDTVSIYIMAVANEIGASVFTSSYDPEMRQLIDNIFPFVRVLPGQRLNQNIMTLTQGEGCDVCIKFTSGGLGSILELVSENGKVIQCATPTEREINLGVMKSGSSLIIPDLTNAVKSFLDKSAEDIQTFLYSMQKGSISKLSTEGFPELKGLKYSLEERSHFLDPVSFSLILSVIEDPGVNMSMLEGMTEADILAMERIHNVITSKPKDCSLADFRLAMDSICDDKENLYESGNILNVGQTDIYPYQSTSSTPCGIRVCRLLGSPSESGSPDESTFPDKIGYQEDRFPEKEQQENPDQKIQVKVAPPTIPEIQIEEQEEEDSFFQSKEGEEKSDIQCTSTPMVGFGKDEPDAENIQQKNTSLISVLQARRVNMKKSSLAMLEIPSSISSFKKGVRKLDLLFVGPPPTPITPAVARLLTPRPSSETTLVPLNDKKEGPNLFMVHPITGKIHLLKPLGNLLRNSCYGIQRTSSTPTKSIPCVASYYKNAIEIHQPAGPYYIVGYSFGSVVALEMALQMQEHGVKRACLIMLDGGPQYFHAQFDAAMADAPKKATEDMRKEYLEMGALINFLQMYTQKVNQDLTMKALLCLPNLEERIQTVVAMTFGNVVLSPNPVKTKWMAAKAKMKKVGMLTPAVTPSLERKFGFQDAAEEIVRLKRIQAAREFITSVHLLYNYRNTGKKLEGDVYLLRIKDDPQGCKDLPVDYGLQDWCTGKVHLHFYDGTHESFLNEDSGKEVAQEIMKIIKTSAQV